MSDKRETLTKAEKGWLAGIIEGEGSITLHVKRKTWKGWKGIGVDLSIWIVNSDQGIIGKTIDILKKMGIEPYIHKRPTVPITHQNGRTYSGGQKTLVAIGTSKMANILKLLKNIEPYLAGEKKTRANLMIQFIERRQKRKGNHTQKGASWYDGYDWKLVKQFYELSGGKLPREVQRIVNESAFLGRSSDPGFPTMKELRIKLGIKQADIADQLGISRTIVSLYENGVRPVPVTIVRKIAEILKVKPDKLRLRRTIHPLTTEPE